ncbi:hypothetical protein CNMCM5793_005619 [Aspergillus hiratsukae]|uniref:Reverse transcriptase domain-containing protein n=1 Tax=Aspergillus hiratsukae TaxID=1194566 RepID=A0A8H6UYH2_9EURO|nr:hypothetical protein CNMCM5793_005619 [Aspergillus hiratsukae]KAF7171913.1 hypothetical protein CNMCM6106_006255 [Aspergillus hiratsukae]
MTIPGRGNPPLDQFPFRVPAAELPKLAGLSDDYASQLTTAFDDAVRIVGKPDRGQGAAASWWSPECTAAHQAWVSARHNINPTAFGALRHSFQDIIRKAKRAYWKHIIDGVKDDKDLYNVLSWHKLTPSLKAPPSALRAAVLGRFNEADDLDEDPLNDWTGTGHLPWDTAVSIEEVEKNTIGVTRTSPGTDRVTVRLLKACWIHIRDALHALYNRCLALCHFPSSWKLAEVAMLPKVGNKDKTSVCSWRPIALLSCISEGLERIVARGISWTALTHGILSPQHGGALPRRSAMDLVAAFTHDVEAALAQGKVVTLVTMDVGCFRRPPQTAAPSAKARVRLEKATTPSYPVQCGTPQGSPLSPILYLLYLTELLLQDTKRRFGYADDMALYQISDTLEENAEHMAKDVQSILNWGATNKVAFAPDKLQAIHFSWKRNLTNPPIIVNDTLTINPIPPAEQGGQQPALRWLGVYLTRRLAGAGT